MTGPKVCISTACVGHCATHSPHRVHNIKSIMGNTHCVITKPAFLISTNKIPERQGDFYDKSLFLALISTLCFVLQRLSIQQNDATAIYPDQACIGHRPQRAPDHIPYRAQMGGDVILCPAACDVFAAGLL